jgi:hypothetical protein
MSHRGHLDTQFQSFDHSVLYAFRPGAPGQTQKGYNDSRKNLAVAGVDLERLRLIEFVVDSQQRRTAVSGSPPTL